MGVHIYHWNDRSSPFEFEQDWSGFGVMRGDRKPKPIYTHLVRVFRKLDEIHIESLLETFAPLFTISDKEQQQRSLLSEESSVGVFFPSEDGDLNRNQMMIEASNAWGAFKRVGLPTYLVDERGLKAMNASKQRFSALYLPFGTHLSPELVGVLESNIEAGVHIHSTGLPGLNLPLTACLSPLFLTSHLHFSLLLHIT